MSLPALCVYFNSNHSKDTSEYYSILSILCMCVCVLQAVINVSISIYIVLQLFAVYLA